MIAMWLFFICFLFLRLTAMGLRMVTRKLGSKLLPRFSSTSLLHSHATSFGLYFSLSLSLSLTYFHVVCVSDCSIQIIDIWITYSLFPQWNGFFQNSEVTLFLNTSFQCWENCFTVGTNIFIWTFYC